MKFIELEYKNKDEWHEEVWKDIKGYEGLYQVSSLGRIKSLERITKGRIRYYKKEKILKNHIGQDGYFKTYLYKLGKVKTCRINRLVAETFIPNPENKPEVNHINEVKTDNRVENLEWTTRKENSLHSSYKFMGENNPRSNSKDFYKNNPITRTQFKKSCKRKKWHFEEFEEIYSGKKQGKNKMYFYRSKDEI